MDQRITIPVVIVITMAATAGVMYSAGFQGAEVPPVDSDKAMPSQPVQDAPDSAAGGNGKGMKTTVEVGDAGDADARNGADPVGDTVAVDDAKDSVETTDTKATVEIKDAGNAGDTESDAAEDMVASETAAVGVTKDTEEDAMPLGPGQTHDIIRISTHAELEDVLLKYGAYWKYRHYANFIAHQLTGNFQGSGSAGGGPSLEGIPIGGIVPNGVGGSAGFAKGIDYSDTNIQVEGVDEPDYVKNDGKYVYVVSGNDLIIIDAYPASGAKVVLKMAFDAKNKNIENMFLNDDRLVVLYNNHGSKDVIRKFGYILNSSYNPVVHALIIDVSDRSSPSILKDYSIKGLLTDARMVGDHAYFVASSAISREYPKLPVILEGSDVALRPDAFYFANTDYLTTFNTLISIGIFAGTVSSDTYLTGQSGALYVSKDNFYITYESAGRYLYDEAAQRDRFFGIIVPLLPSQTREQIGEIARDGSPITPQEWNAISILMQDAYNGMEDGERGELFSKIEAELERYDDNKRQRLAKTIIHKVSIDGSDIKYAAKGYVPGRLLNQFSMDEHEDRFRVATTLNYHTESQGSVRDNAVYVLDEDLERVGSLEGIAPTESIFSARFIGERLYMVTFRQVDPFYVVDLSADKPRILGELKIPGFSDYLHPYDENHIIGVGRDSVNEGNRASQLGVKIAIFNVEDVSNPIVADDVIIGGRGTESAALDTHKAFFFDRASGLLSIPISSDYEYLVEVIKIRLESDRWNGFYVYDLSNATLDLKGFITHSQDGDQWMKDGRTFYIEDTLYTVSDGVMKMNAMSGLDEVNTIRFDDAERSEDYLK